MKDLKILSDFVRENGGQRRVSKILKCSHSYLSEVLKGKKGGAKIFDLLGLIVRAETVQCPIFGEISKQECKRNHSKELIGTNSFNVKLHRACETCMQRWNCKE